jgi:hypothetical protein
VCIFAGLGSELEFFGSAAVTIPRSLLARLRSANYQAHEL